jgi:type I restriction enzyme S subunit
VEDQVVKIPLQKNEQSTIASILFDMDREIESLEHKRDKYRDIKQGMMQQLLTGNIRIYGNK